MTGLLLPIPIPSPSVNPLRLALHWSCFLCLLKASFVSPSARRTWSFDEGWCLIPCLPRPLISNRAREGPWVTHDWAEKKPYKSISMKLREGEKRDGEKDLPTTSFSRFKPFAIAWSRASAIIESNRGACFFCVACTGYEKRETRMKSVLGILSSLDQGESEGSPAVEGELHLLFSPLLT